MSIESYSYKELGTAKNREEYAKTSSEGCGAIDTSDDSGKCYDEHDGSSGDDTLMLHWNQSIESKYGLLTLSSTLQVQIFLPSGAILEASAHRCRELKKEE